MKIKTSKLYLAASICAAIYATVAEFGKPNGEPFNQFMWFIGFWMLGCSFSEAETKEQLLEVDVEVGKGDA